MAVLDEQERTVFISVGRGEIESGEVGQLSVECSRDLTPGDFRRSVQPGCLAREIETFPPGVNTSYRRGIKVS